MRKSQDNYLSFYRVWERVYNHPELVQKIKYRPWARSISARSIRESSYEFLCFKDNGPADEIKNIVELMPAVAGKGVHIGRRSGYIHPDAFIIMPFNGQWGIGIAVVENAGNSTVSVTFYTVYTRQEVEAWHAKT